MQKMTVSHWNYIGFDGEVIPCEAPASMYSVLLTAGRIKDPFFRMQEKEVTPLSYHDCAFEAVIEADAALLASPYIVLRFEGIDTLCDIYLNGRKLFYAENMHRTFELDVKDRLHLGENQLRLCFHSPLKAMTEAQNRYYLTTDGNCFDGAAHFRKAFYMMGWDWGPCLPDMGIWRPVYLLTYETRLTDVEVHQHHEKGSVTLSLGAALEGNKAGTAVRYTLTSPDGKMTLAVDGNEDGDAALTVTDPALWWPNGYGKQPLYTLKTEVLCGGIVQDEKTMRLGLRTLTVSTAKDKWGKEFCFVINGKKIFSMGANYIPEDNILARLTPARTEKLLRQCIRANFNTIRVWGGGFYPFDWFYELCDELGLIVWQDFMFACMNVHMTPSYEANICAEFGDNLRRIRHHASLGMLCGNNEMELFVSTSKTYGSSETVKQDYLYLYERILPDVCRKFAPDTFYWPSSPSSGGGFQNANGSECGDAHYWNVWHSRKPVTDYRKQTFRFCSEFGFEALPTKETAESFSLPCDRNFFSPVMNHHQKCKGANGTVMYYVSEYYPYPEGFDATLYASQVMQAFTISYAVEHFRRIRGRCMGATYWQLNDCWPVISWSSVDSGEREKALHHAARRFFAPVLLSANDEGTKATFNISNEKLTPFKGQIKIALCNRDLEVLEEQCYPAEVDALSAKDIVTRDFAELVKGREHKTYAVYTLLDEEGNTLSTATMLFVRPKFFAIKRPSIKATVTGEGAVKQIHLTADTFVSKLRIDFADPTVEADDQYFDITDQTGVTVNVNAPHLTAAALEKQISFFSVADIAPTCLGCNE